MMLCSIESFLNLFTEPTHLRVGPLSVIKGDIYDT